MVPIAGKPLQPRNRSVIRPFALPPVGAVAGAALMRRVVPPRRADRVVFTVARAQAGLTCLPARATVNTTRSARSSDASEIFQTA